MSHQFTLVNFVSSRGLVSNTHDTYFGVHFEEKIETEMD
jgi:hypothetical protein